jgi:hypothetical protein
VLLFGRPRQTGDDAGRGTQIVSRPILSAPTSVLIGRAAFHGNAEFSTEFLFWGHTEMEPTKKKNQTEKGKKQKQKIEKIKRKKKKELL